MTESATMHSVFVLIVGHMHIKYGDLMHGCCRKYRILHPGIGTQDLCNSRAGPNVMALLTVSKEPTLTEAGNSAYLTG